MQPASAAVIRGLSRAHGPELCFLRVSGTRAQADTLRVQCPIPVGAWRSLVAHSLGVRVVVGSNPAAPTKTPGLISPTEAASAAFFVAMAATKIFVTNDDGIGSPGLHALAAALRGLGDVWVVAPDRERTAVGHALTLHKPLRINRLDKRVFSVNGTPTDCVNLGIKEVLGSMPVLLVSGINRGVNLGDDVTYSGTVSAALEGTILGVPSLAISQEGKDRFRFEVAADYAARIAKLVIEYGLPEETLLNVNVPNCSGRTIKGVQVTSLSRRRFENPIIEKIDPHGRKYYWIAGTRVSWDRSKGSDHEAIRRRMVSITPIHLDTTNHAALERFRPWETLIMRPRDGARARVHATRTTRK